MSIELPFATLQSDSKEVYPQGCLAQLMDLARYNTNIIVGVGATAAIIHLLCIAAGSITVRSYTGVGSKGGKTA